MSNVADVVGIMKRLGVEAFCPGFRTKNIQKSGTQKVTIREKGRHLLLEGDRQIETRRLAALAHLVATGAPKLQSPLDMSETFESAFHFDCTRLPGNDESIYVSGRATVAPGGFKLESAVRVRRNGEDVSLGVGTSTVTL